MFGKPFNNIVVCDLAAGQLRLGETELRQGGADQLGPLLRAQTGVQGGDQVLTQYLVTAKGRSATNISNC